MMGSQNICGTICHIDTEFVSRYCSGDFEHCIQHNSEITRDMNLSGSHNRLTNVLESGDNRGLRSNNAWTNTLYESQRCDDVAGVENMRHNHPKRH